MIANRRQPDLPRSWQPALEAAREPGMILLLGETDSGKSTLAALLAREALAAGRTVAVVDADIGQSSIGPPTCVGLAFPQGEFGALSDLAADHLDFVGTCSPVGHLLQLAASTAVLANLAWERAETTIVDTTGLVSGAAGHALKTAKVRLLDPDVIVALQREDEIAPLLGPYRARVRPRVMSLRVSRAARERSREQRAANRRARFAQYFSGARTITLSWEEAPIENSPWSHGDPLPGHIVTYAEDCLARDVLHAEQAGDCLLLITNGKPDPNGLDRVSEGYCARIIDGTTLTNLVVGLLGDRGQTLALGLLESVDYRARALAVYTPSDGANVRGLRLGSVRIARDGEQLGALDTAQTPSRAAR